MSEDTRKSDVSPTARWLVHGAWKIALTAVVIVLVVGVVAAIVD